MGYKHGYARKGKKPKIYRIWCAMKGRCHCKTDSAYHNYGGRGIEVCKRWRESFQAFYDDVSKLPHFGEEGYSLNRIDNDVNYELSNVEWATEQEQSFNRRTNFLVTYNDITLPLKQLTDELGLNYKKIWKRINVFGWSVEKAILEKENPRDCYITYRGQRKLLAEWAKERNLKYNTLQMRLRRGWPIEKALETP